MGKQDKLIKELLKKPPEMRFDDMKKILEHAGFKNVRTRGSHFVFKNYENGKKISIPTHNHRVKKCYLEEIIEILNLED
jgi:predicted RNA binding protein YcfA (HicA-like mRNA interferase family)